MSPRWTRRTALAALISGGLTARTADAARGVDTYSTVDSFDEIAFSPSGEMCALQAMWDGDFSSILVFGSNFDSPVTWQFPDRRTWVRDITFGEDDNVLYFTAASAPFDLQSAICRLDLTTGSVSTLAAHHVHCSRLGYSPTANALWFGTRVGPGSPFELWSISLSGDVVIRRPAPPLAILFKVLPLPDGGAIIGCVRELGRYDEEHMFARAFHLAPDGDLAPLPISQRGTQDVMALGVDQEGRILLSLRERTTERATFNSLAWSSDRGITVEPAEMPAVSQGRQVSAASVALETGAVALNVMGWPGREPDFRSGKIVALPNDQFRYVGDLVATGERRVMLATS